MNLPQFSSVLPASLRAFGTTVVGCLLVAAAGCGEGIEKPDHIPDLTATTVSVTYNGTPVEGASVIFAPDAQGFSASGITDAEGKAVMKTDGMYDGVVAGEYRASVTKRDQVDMSDIIPSDDPADHGAGAKALTVQQKPTEAPKYLVPQKYSSFGTSGLTVTVSEGTPAEIAFELTDLVQGFADREKL